MRRLTEFARTLELTVLAVMLLGTSATVIGQQQPPAVAHPSTSNVQGTPRRTASPLGNATNTITGMKPAVGAIGGFVYWQVNVFQPQSDCQGLTAKVATVTKSGLPLQLLSTTSTFTAMGPVTDYSAQSAPKYMLCSYSFHNMPENVYLRVLLYGPPPSTSVVIPSAFQIPRGNCNSTPPSSLSFILTGGETICGDNAFNINFKLTSAAAAAPRPTASSILLPHGPTSGGMLSKPQAAPADATPVAPNTRARATLLSPESSAGNMNTPGSTGMLAPAAKSGGTANAIGGNGGFTGGVKSTAPQRLLTNAEVIRMQKAGISESVIVHSIQSSTKQFDFSPTGIKALQQAHVSPAVLAAMCDGSARCPAIQGDSTPATPGSKVELNPQPLPPRISSAKSSSPSTANGPVGKKAEFIAGPRLRNPKASSDGLTSEIRSALQAQRTFYLAHPAAVISGPLNTQDLSVTKPPPLSPHPSGGANSKLIAEPINLHTKLCMPGSPGVHSVNNVTSGASFSPDTQYNAYIIDGCNFGSDPGAVHLFGAFNNPSQMTFSIDSGGWNDQQLYLHLNPNISGELDNNNVTLVIQRADGVTSHIGGFKFVAARDTQNPFLLTYVPQAVVTLGPSLPLNSGQSFGTGSSNLSSLYVGRSAQKLFSAGHDSFDFTKMLPGFVVWDVQHDYSDQIKQYQEAPPRNWSKWDWARWGSWNTQFDSNGIRVDYEVDYLNWQVFVGTEDWNDYMSEYSLRIWIVGPRGVTNPWPANLH